ncbi:MAG: hypothetical protein HWN80_11850 [Candidatus Lokiarchaeota archaeon]|nr:hypothetical protein [Candidatus Lokiarchaeota archaeon]
MKIDIEILKKLERSIDTYNPEKGEVSIKILGYGEISLVFEIVGDPKQIAYKRIPIFENEKQVNRHIWAYNEYNRILIEEVGLNLPGYDVAWFKDEEEKIQFYCVQEKISSESVGNRVIHELSKEDVNTLILLAMREMKKVWLYSKNHETIDLGLDGQISNFAVIGYDPNNPEIREDTKLIYFDTSTPMFRKNGIEAMDAELFLKSTPSFLRFLVKAAFLDEVVDRYYDWRLVTIDLIANFFKEQKPELIPGIIRQVNKFFKEEASEFNMESITFEEVQKYYKNDKMIWVIFQNARKIDRYLKTKLFKKKYDFYLPGKIKR